MNDFEGVELTGLGGQVEEAYRMIADQLVHDATQFQFFVKSYYDHPLRIDLLQGVKITTDTILEQWGVMVPLLTALSQYLDKIIKVEPGESDDITD